MTTDVRESRNLNVDSGDAGRIGHKSRKIYPAISPAAQAKKYRQRDVAISGDFTFYRVDWRQASYTADSDARVCVSNVCEKLIR